MHNRSAIAVVLAAAMMLLGLSGCASQPAGTVTETAATTTGEVHSYALVTKSEGNPFNERMAEGFVEVIDAAGGNGIVASPKEATAEAQIEMLQDLISQGVDSIAVAANDAEALSSVLEEAMRQGIQVSTVDSDVSSSDRQVFVNQVSTETLAQTLVDAVYDITGGSGQWAILSATSTATNQNAWIRAMRGVLEEEKYQDLRLVDIVYGDDESETSARETEELLAEYPDLEVICAPTTMGLAAAAEVLAAHPESDVKVTGLGLPSEMAAYVTGDDPVCPQLYLWNPIDLGRMSGYVSLALVSGKITGGTGDVFKAGDQGTYVIEENDTGGTQVIVGSPIRFDADNIDQWKDLF